LTLSLVDMDGADATLSWTTFGWTAPWAAGCRVQGDEIFSSLRRR
jgi:hypothetical protein